MKKQKNGKYRLSGPLVSKEELEIIQLTNSGPKERLLEWLSQVSTNEYYFSNKEQMIYNEIDLVNKQYESFEKDMNNILEKERRKRDRRLKKLNKELLKLQKIQKEKIKVKYENPLEKEKKQRSMAINHVLAMLRRIDVNERSKNNKRVTYLTPEQVKEVIKEYGVKTSDVIKEVEKNEPDLIKQYFKKYHELL